MTKKELVMHLKKNRAFIPYIRNRKAFIKEYPGGHAVLFTSISRAFDWASSEQGHTYWNNLYKNGP